MSVLPRVAYWGLRRCGIILTVTIVISGILAVTFFRFTIKPNVLDVFVSNASYQNFVFTNSSHVSVKLSYTFSVLNRNRGVFLYYKGLTSNLSRNGKTMRAYSKCFTSPQVNLLSFPFTAFNVTNETPIPRTVAKDLMKETRSGMLYLNVTGYFQFRYKAIWLSGPHYVDFQCSSVAFGYMTSAVPETTCSYQYKKKVLSHNYVNCKSLPPDTLEM